VAKSIPVFGNDYLLAQVRQGKTKIHILEKQNANSIFNGVVTEIRFSEKERIQIQPTIREVNYVVTFGKAITPLVIRAKGSISQCGNEIINYTRAYQFFENYSIRAGLTNSQGSPQLKLLQIVIPQHDNRQNKGSKTNDFTLEAYLVSFNLSQTDPNFPVFDVTLEFVKGL